MSRYQNRRARRSMAWARRPSLSARVLGEAALEPANDVLVLEELAPPHVRAANDTFADDEPPFDPPDEDDEIFLGRPSTADCDDEAPYVFEETAPPFEQAPEIVFSAPAPANETQLDLFVAQRAFTRPTPLVEPEAPTQIMAAEPPPFDDADEEEAVFVDAAPAPPAIVAEEDPPFDAPDDSDDVFGATFERVPLSAFAPAPDEPAAAREEASEPPPAPELEPVVAEITEDAPAPPIRIHACWDRPEIGKLLAQLGADHRLARADIDIARGGIESAFMHFSGRESPDLLILDSTLKRAEMLAALDRLASAVHADCKIIILGVLNDIGLLRELALRGVSEYIVPPLNAGDLARAVCRLYAQNDQSRVIAVVGARGGVGASTLAHNLAWSIAERQDACAALIELDLAFGGAVVNVGKSDDDKAVGDLLSAPPEAISAEALSRATIQHTKHLQSIRAPATLERMYDLSPDTVEKLVYHARRANPYVVLDLPHAWNGWVKQALASADDIVLVAAPDLASLRNCKGMLESLAALRPGKPAPPIVLSMVGAPKRPEVSFKDFSESVGAAPAAQISFDPMLFGLCETTSQMIGEAEPDSRAATAIDALAAALTGRKPVARKRTADSAILARDGSADFAKSPKRGAREPAAPTANDNVLVLTRETSIGQLTATYEADSEGEYLAKARNAAQAELDAGKRRPFKWRRVAMAAAAAGLAIANAAWRAEDAPAATAPAPVHAAAVSAPAPSSQYASALLLLGEGRVREARPLLQAAAEAGFAPAQHRLAQFYEQGEAGVADPSLARAWTERAAANGNVRAMHDLGVYYAQSDDPAHVAAAFRWFRQAAEFGVADSQYNLGVLYHEGRGVSADTNEALFWFRVAAAQGDAEAGARASALALAVPPAAAESAATRASAFRPRPPSAAANAAS